MRLLSIHFGHDSSICLLDNGKIEKYFLVERFTRKKHDHNISKILKFIFENIKGYIDFLCLSTFNREIDQYEVLKKIFENYKQYNPNLKIITNSDHHLNHACLSFYNSGFNESVVIVVDGCGSIVDKNLNLVEVESIYLFNGKSHKLLYKNLIEGLEYSYQTFSWRKKFNNKEIKCEYDYKNIFGIGGIYDIAAILTGNTANDCGKAMGLSSYGNSNSNFKNIIIEKNTINNNFYKESSEEIKNFLKYPTKEITKTNYKIYADFCYEIQLQTQKSVGDLIEEQIEKTGLKNVCISGGYGMNIVSNYYYTQRFPDINFYFEPLCGDSGSSIGSAMLSYVNTTGKIPSQIKNTFFHGLDYDVAKYKGKPATIKDIAKLLYENKSVAVYTGFSEAGQRALGNRSILFNALNPNAKDLVNKIKKREWYRPFACIVLEEDADEYFNMQKIKSSPFMTLCFPVKAKYFDVISGVVHIDGTSRIQTISQSDGYLYELLWEFKKLSKHGILLNTSFNLAGEPLVESPEDSFNTLKKSSLDYLWFSDTNQLFENTYKFVTYS